MNYSKNQHLQSKIDGILWEPAEHYFLHRNTTYSNTLNKHEKLVNEISYVVMLLQGCLERFPRQYGLRLTVHNVEKSSQIIKREIFSYLDTQSFKVLCKKKASLGFGIGSTRILFSNKDPFFSIMDTFQIGCRQTLSRVAISLLM